MKKICRIAAGFCAGVSLCSSFAGISAFAAEKEKTAPKTVNIETVCPDFVPLSDDLIRILPVKDCKLHAKIVQHSPERENLVLYDSDISAESGVYYVFAAEPGDYTVSFTMAAIENSRIICKYEQDIQIENADYSTGENAFARTVYQFGIEKNTAAADEKPSAALIASNGTVKDGVKNVVTGVQFNTYGADVFRGDYDGNGETDLTDAQLALAAYTAQMGSVEPKKKTDEAHKQASDINADGEISLDDAQSILKFYTLVMSQAKTIVWPDGLPDSRYPAPAAATA